MVALGQTNLHIYSNKDGINIIADFEFERGKKEFEGEKRKKKKMRC